MYRIKIWDNITMTNYFLQGLFTKDQGEDLCKEIVSKGAYYAQLWRDGSTTPSIYHIYGKDDQRVPSGYKKVQ